MARNYEPMKNVCDSEVCGNEVCGSEVCERQSCKSCSANDADHDVEERNEAFDRAHLARIIISGVLFLVGAIFHDQLHATPYSWAEYVVLVPAYLLVGFPVLKEAFFDVVHGKVFNEMFLMSVATLGAFAIHQVPEAVGVMLFYSVGEYLQDMAVDKSRRSIRELMDLRPDFARLYEGGKTREVAPASVRIGDNVEVRPGERFPLDGKVVEGESFVDTSSLTGESVPRRVAPGSDVLAGYINDNGRVLVQVGAEFGDSAVSRILELMEHASANKAPTEKFISKFAAVYTPIVVALASFIAFVPPLVVPGATFSEFVYRALVLLVISCPCALVVSVPLGYFAGIGNASKNRILVKGANYLDALTKLDSVVFDKTGTLTKGVFSVTDVVPYNGFSREALLRYAAAAEYGSTHPIARSIRQAAALLPAQSLASAMSRIENPSEKKGYGVRALVDGHDVMAGNDRMLHGEQIPHDNCNPGGTVVHVVVDGHYAGYILISDIVKEGAAQAVHELKREGARKVVMLTGDDEAVAGRIASDLGIDTYYAGLLPQEKVEKLQQIKREAPQDKTVAFVGDGMNDAPVLMTADVGVAMGGLGSDAAIEAADLVIMDDDICRVPLAIRIAKHTHSIVRENVAFALSVKAIFIVLGGIGYADMWQAVIADVGVSLLAVLNSLRAAGMRRDAGMADTVRK